MVAMLILCNVDETGLQLLNQFDLLLDQYMFESLLLLASAMTVALTPAHLLYDPATVWLRRQVNDLALHSIGQHPLLHLVAILEQLLHYVVAEHILHQLDCVGFDFGKNAVPLVTVGRLELRLDKPRRLLVAAEFDDVVPDILNNVR